MTAHSTYYRRKTNKQCTSCGSPALVPSELKCAGCKERNRQRLEQYYETHVAPYLATWHAVKARLPLLPPKEPEPVQQIACCGGIWHAILHHPLRTACCGRVLALEEG